MSQGFRLRFDQMRESNPTQSDATAQPSESNPFWDRPRNLGLVWPDGRRYFLSYAYLIAGECKSNGTNTVIQLQFSAHVVTLLGYGLDELFLDLVEQRVRWIVVQEERYQALDEAQAVVMDVQIELKT